MSTVLPFMDGYEEENEDKSSVDPKAVTWSQKNPHVRKHCHPKHGVKPIGIFKCVYDYDYAYQNITHNAAAYVWSLEGWYPCNFPQDLQRSYDAVFMREDYFHKVEYMTAQLKGTTQRTKKGRSYAKTIRWQEPSEEDLISKMKKGKSEVSLRGNMGSAKRGGNKNRPFAYDRLFAINEEGEYCWWMADDIKNNKSTVVFGANNGRTGKFLL